MAISKQNWVLGQCLSLDEIDVGFQGRYAHKDKIKYKGEGDGFLLDSICDSGLLYATHFRHDPCPVVEKDASPLHNRCLYLVEQCKDAKWHVFFFDNLFTSKNFLDWLYKREALGAGVCRTSARGLPGCVIQDVVTKKADLEHAVGTVKVARSSDYKTIAASIYDAKPVHFMSTFHTSVHDIQKSRKIYDVNVGAVVDMPFTRLNIINDYNYDMNGVDLCDQLRNHNAYLCYEKVCLKEKAEPISHRRFLELLSERLCHAEAEQ
eukprot:gene23803-28858_t